MLSQKRNPDDGDGPADGDNPDDKRRKFCLWRYYYYYTVLLSLLLRFKGFCFTDLWDGSFLVVHMEVF